MAWGSLITTVHNTLRNEDTCRYRDRGSSYFLSLLVQDGLVSGEPYQTASVQQSWHQYSTRVYANIEVKEQLIKTYVYCDFML